MIPYSALTAGQNQSNFEKSFVTVEGEIVELSRTKGIELSAVMHKNNIYINIRDIRSWGKGEFHRSTKGMFIRMDDMINVWPEMQRIINGLMDRHSLQQFTDKAV